MSELDSAVRDYYASTARREHARLERAEGAVEFELTCRVLAAHLPSGARVLDLGGGSGRYARWLATHGHRVVLADVTRELLDVAREFLRDLGPAVEAIGQADARDLSRWSDAEFDAVIALGPFYHLTEEADRRQAANEVARVLRAGGVAFVALIPRYAFLRASLAIPTDRHRLHDPAFITGILESGIFVSGERERFTGAYGIEPRDATRPLASSGLRTVAVHALEAFVPDLSDAVAEVAAAAPAAYATLLEALYERSTDESLFGTANHLLVVSRKPEVSR